MTVRVRFAPSPTGHLHVGGARTALFNWLFARKMGGTFILRIEDTDRERSDPAMTKGILEAMSWMGLDWDEGPYYQSERLDRYRDLARTLEEGGHAYRCFCSPEQLAALRAEASASGVGWKYPGTCLSLDKKQVRERLDSGETAALRFRVPDGRIRFDDLVFGEITKGPGEVEDFVLLRSDGHPTYHLSVVADDLDMKMTHVLRGADHISNTPKQILLFDALEAPRPQFVHVPLILGPDKSRLSKRHGATSVLAYRDQGILPEAFDNLLALMGWSDGTDQEIFDTHRLIEAFSLEGISKADAVFDPDKLEWFNGQYINALSPEALSRCLVPVLEDTGIWEDRFDTTDRAWFLSLIELIRPRFRSLQALAREVRTYSGVSVEYEPAALRRFMSDSRLEEYLPELALRLEKADPFDLHGVEKALRALAAELEVKAGLLINAARVSLTGKAVAPGIFDVMVVLGRDKTVDRLRRAVSAL
jgi:glutamyl-tRNA synthetase